MYAIRSYYGLRELRRSFQLVLQDPYGSLPPQTSIGAILEEPLIIHKLGNKQERKEKALAVMNEVGLPTYLFNELPNGLSAGQRQRLNVARAMILEPKLLIMDETLSALDQTDVITSYSIHYTKLYEVQLNVMEVAAWNERLYDRPGGGPGHMVDCGWAPGSPEPDLRNNFV